MSKMEVFKAIGVIGVLSALLGCGSSDDGEGGGISSSTADALSGVYELTHFTQNKAGCDAEGLSVLDGFSDRHFVVTSMMVLGDRVVILASCSDIEDCRQKARAMQNRGSFGHEYSFMLTSEIDATRVAGFEASTGSSNGDGSLCTNREYSDHSMTLSSPGAVRLESRTKLLADRPAEDGFCVVTPAESKSEAAGLPCGELRVLEGTKVAGLS